MEFSEIQDAVIGTRFNEGQRDSAIQWINWRYQWVNGMEEWPWMAPVNGTFAIGGNQMIIGANVIRILSVYDNDNDIELQYLDPNEYRRTYLNSDEGTTPETYTITIPDGASLNVYDEVIKLGPPSSATNSLDIVFRKRPPDLAANNDVPVWPSAYHFNLALGAIATGLKIENDPTWEALETEFLAGVDAMRTEALPPGEPDTRQYGRELFDAWL